MSSKPTVFIVDDDPAIRRALTVRLESMDLRAEAYGSAEEFLDACDHSQPGCILLDVRLPGISGLELLGRIVRDKLHLPVIFISAHGDVPMVVQALKGGALNFLEKPCRAQQLWEAVQEALQWDMENRKQIARSTKIQQRIGRLNDGEREVLEMVLAGLFKHAIPRVDAHQPLRAGGGQPLEVLATIDAHLRDGPVLQNPANQRQFASVLYQT